MTTHLVTGFLSILCAVAAAAAPEQDAARSEEEAVRAIEAMGNVVERDKDGHVVRFWQRAKGVRVWRKDKDGYARWVSEKIAARPERSHGFRFRGQYEAQVPGELSAASQP